MEAVPNSSYVDIEQELIDERFVTHGLNSIDLTVHFGGNETAFYPIFWERGKRSWVEGQLPPPNCASFPSTMVQRPLTSAAGVLSLLSESDTNLRQHALLALNPLIPQFWAEISENLTEVYASFRPHFTRLAYLSSIIVRLCMSPMICPNNLVGWQP